jgi:glycosyltransferase involved in cell wall biosynthesis
MLAILSTHPIQYQTPIWSRLGAEGRIPFEVWYLSDFGIRPSYDAEFGKAFKWDVDILSGYPYQVLNKGSDPNHFWKCRLQTGLHDRIRESGVKAVWIQGWQVAGYWQAVHQAAAAGVEVWLRADSNDLSRTSWWKKPFKYPALRYFFSHVDRFLCVGSANRRLYSQYGVSKTKLFDAPHAVDNNRLASQADKLRPKRGEIRRQWGIQDDAFCVLFCGKFIAKKRPFDLIHAAGHLRKDGRMPNIHLLFVGSGELQQELRAACDTVFDSEPPNAARTGNGAVRASFAGFLNQSEISQAYVAADCLVLPSDSRETWGLVVNEALVSGLPCITSNQCGCTEDLIGPEWSFKVGDSARLADKIAAVHSARGSYPCRPVPAISETVATVSRLYDELP